VRGVEDPGAGAASFRFEFKFKHGGDYKPQREGMGMANSKLGKRDKSGLSPLP
jgi:hypothetical protein